MASRVLDSSVSNEPDDTPHANMSDNMEVPGSKPGGVKTSKNFRLFPGPCNLRNVFFQGN